MGYAIGAPVLDVAPIVVDMRRRDRQARSPRNGAHHLSNRSAAHMSAYIKNDTLDLVVS